MFTRNEQGACPGASLCITVGCMQVMAAGATNASRAFVKLLVHDGPLSACDSLLVHWGVTTRMEG